MRFCAKSGYTLRPSGPAGSRGPLQAQAQRAGAGPWGGSPGAAASGRGAQARGPRSGGHPGSHGGAGRAGMGRQPRGHGQRPGGAAQGARECGAVRPSPRRGQACFGLNLQGAAAPYKRRRNAPEQGRRAAAQEPRPPAVGRKPGGHEVGGTQGAMEARGAPEWGGSPGATANGRGAQPRAPANAGRHARDSGEARQKAESPQLGAFVGTPERSEVQGDEPVEVGRLRQQVQGGIGHGGSLWCREAARPGRVGDLLKAEPGASG